MRYLILIVVAVMVSACGANWSYMHPHERPCYERCCCEKEED